MLHRHLAVTFTQKISAKFLTTRAVARTEMGEFWTNRLVENGFYHKLVSLGLDSLENGLTWVNTRAKLKKMGKYTPVETGVFSYFSWK